MTRHETIWCDSWRVRVRNGVLVTHESLFSDQDRAWDYYYALDLLGAEIQWRRAGRHRYETLATKVATVQP